MNYLILGIYFICSKVLLFLQTIKKFGEREAFCGSTGSSTLTFEDVIILRETFGESNCDF
jgi:hypothetical protein